MSKHRAISRGRWQQAQKQTLEWWYGKNLSEERNAAEAKYLPIILPLTEGLSEDARVLEIGCGAICLTHALSQKNKTYLDPLIDNLRRIFPGELSEGEFLSSAAEAISKEDQSFDLIVCLNTIPHALNPELIINEIRRLLNNHGILILSMDTHSGLEARLHYLAERILPILCRGTCPYFYSLAGIRNTLNRHFEIKEDILVEEKRTWLPGFARQEHLFVCSLKGQKPKKADPSPSSPQA